MAIYTYEVHKVSPYFLSVEASTLVEAQLRVKTLTPTVIRVTLESRFEGTFDDWIGAESVKRIRDKKHTLKLEADSKKRALNVLRRRSA